MKVEPSPGEQTVFNVQGNSKKWYRVDIAELNQNGWCSCHDFYYRHHADIQGEMRRGEAPSRHRCKHIEAAREFALDLVLRAHEKRQGKKP